LILGGVDFVTMHGKLEWEALDGENREGGKAFFKMTEGLVGRGSRI